METELTQIETLSLKDYINKEMAKLNQECQELFGDDSKCTMNNMVEIATNIAKLVSLQEIAYRLEYGFITEIGKTSLKHHLVGRI